MPNNASSPPDTAFAILSGVRIRHVELGNRPVEYMKALALQQQYHRRVAAGQEPNTLLLLEHEPVYTAGSRTEPQDRPTNGAPVVETDRGGRITWHGPGQLVGYPIVRLPHPFDVLAYVRELEELLMTVCRHLGVSTHRVEGRSGVWVTAPDPPSQRKIAAIGVRVSRGTTRHGFALNCNCDLDWADPIVPCGISDAGVTSLTQQLGRDLPVTIAARRVEDCLRSTR